MAEVNILPVGCSPKPPTISDLSPVEEEKVISISESTESTIASPPYGHKVSFSCSSHDFGCLCKCLQFSAVLFINNWAYFLDAQILAELVGTYVIIFAGCGCVLIDKKYRLTVTGIAVGWGMIVMVMIYTLGHVSGGHFNPAVTIAFAASRKFPWRQASILSSFFNCCEHRIVASCSVSICCT